MPFENPFALIALLSVIPLIILYMLRPKPAVLLIPSLMFVLKLERERKRVYASLTKIVQDPLFLIQLFQSHLPLNPAHLKDVSWDSASTRQSAS